MADAPPPLAILGATASGKTAVAVAVAQRVGGEVISLDSRQLYRGMDIGTAKPDSTERAGVPHHGFDLVGPDERFSAGRFATFARSCMEQIAARGAVAVLAGGTGFFLRALTHPLFDEPPLDAATRERWKGYLAELPVEELRRWASALDPAAAGRAADRQRLARLVEIAVLTGRPLSWWHSNAPPAAPAIDLPIFVLDLPREQLYARIDARVAAMVGAGLVAEVGSLIERGYTERDPGMNATGYRELIPYVRGETTLEEALDEIRRATRQYARRQLTWLRNQLPSHAVRVDAARPVQEVAAEIIDVWRREGRA
jgi:tRNA dimethylallyltransferase